MNHDAFMRRICGNFSMKFSAYSFKDGECYTEDIHNKDYYLLRVVISQYAKQDEKKVLDRFALEKVVRPDDLGNFSRGFGANNNMPYIFHAWNAFYFDEYQCSDTEHVPEDYARDIWNDLAQKGFERIA